MSALGYASKLLDVSLLQRLKHVLEMRGWSARRWSREAGLKEATHLSSTMRRLRTGPNATVEVDTLSKLAESARVSFEWLATGKGSPNALALTAQDDPQYPSRGRVVAAAYLLGYPDRAIDSILMVRDLVADPGIDYWLSLVQARAMEATLPGTTPGAPKKKRTKVRPSE